MSAGIALSRLVPDNQGEDDMGRTSQIRTTAEKHPERRAWEIEFDAAKAGEVFVRVDLRLIRLFGDGSANAAHYRRLGARVASPEDPRDADNDCGTRIVRLERAAQSRR
jgi:hypothetical protein